MNNRRTRSMLRALAALTLALCLLTVPAGAENAPGDDWVTFILLCNEGMNNAGGNAGNTIMVVAMNPTLGKTRLMTLTWDTFIEYEGYDTPQKIDTPYRNGGPEATMQVFNDNFGMNISRYMSLNFLNLASLIDRYGGVTVDLTRAERNALNGMVASKKEEIEEELDAGLISQLMAELIAREYYLEDFGPETHLNGLQAVGYGWLQYDSVYSCCERELEVISCLFAAVGNTIAKKTALYNNETGAPEITEGRRPINVDEMTEDDIAFLRKEIAPIFEMSYNNLKDEDITAISLALVQSGYAAARQGLNIFDPVVYTVFPLEAQDEYDIIAGVKGHLIDTEANREAIVAFLYAAD